MQVSLFTVTVVAVLTLLYHFLPARQLPRKQPRLAIFPKYRFDVDLPNDVTEADDPKSALTHLLGRHGFAESECRIKRITYSRGVWWAQSIGKGLLRLTLELPLASQSTVIAKAGWIIAFDTGDLWGFCSELQENLRQLPAHATEERDRSFKSPNT